MKKSDLYREWARVLDMCEGTTVDPGLCWMLEGEGRDFAITPAFMNAPEDYSLAVAILEDKPVFVGDKVWNTRLNRFVEIEDEAHIRLLVDVGQAAWKPPKVTFTLNGEELPCPDWQFDDSYKAVLHIDGGVGHKGKIKFRSADSRNKVADAIIKILKDATK